MSLFSILQTPEFGCDPKREQRNFRRMLAAAVAVHALVFAVSGFMGPEKVTNIPVRPLSFKLGDQDRIAAYNPGAQPDAPEVAAPVMQATNSRISAVAPEKPAPKSHAAQTEAKPKREKPSRPAIPESQRAEIKPPEVAPSPQQYVRETGQEGAGNQPSGAPDGAIGGQGNQTTQTEKTSREIRDRYEQQISSWIEKHKIYPAEAGGREGRVVVRMRIDRSGTVRYYALEQSSGVRGIDDAALDMIRRANPVPAAPINYPAGNLVEFLIPITFKAPQ